MAFHQTIFHITSYAQAEARGSFAYRHQFASNLTTPSRRRSLAELGLLEKAWLCEEHKHLLCYVGISFTIPRKCLVMSPIVHHLVVMFVIDISFLHLHLIKHYNRIRSQVFPVHTLLVVTLHLFVLFPST